MIVQRRIIIAGYFSVEIITCRLEAEVVVLNLACLRMRRAF